MKKLICLCLLLAVMLFSIDKSMAGSCGLTGTTAQCSASGATYPNYDEAFETYNPTPGIPISVNISVSHSDPGFVGWEVNWGSNFWANGLDAPGMKTIPAGDNSGWLWLWVSASSGTGSITATW